MSAVSFLREDWTEEDGSVLWWRFPICEAPYVGTPFDDDFPDCVTHWTRIDVPDEPFADAIWLGEKAKEER